MICDDGGVGLGFEEKFAFEIGSPRDLFKGSLIRCSEETMVSLSLLKGKCGKPLRPCK